MVLSFSIATLWVGITGIALCKTEVSCRKMLEPFQGIGKEKELFYVTSGSTIFR